ncbi:Flp family type IVb pilin [Actinomycetota bacterium]
MKKRIISYLRNLIYPVGATAVEYAIIIVLIAAVIVIIVASLGEEVRELFIIPGF